MIDCIFTLDYEIYGNGEGSLKDLVYEPAEGLKAIFQKYGKRFVVFVEAAELEMIEANDTDSAVDLVKHQIQDFYREGFELALHLHPQWYKGQHHDGKWVLDYNEYNLCALPRGRITEIVGRSIAYFRNVLGVADFSPLSFRAGNWLFQPSGALASVLTEHDIKVDSSVYKGGVQRQLKLDYRRALRNGYYWTFTDHVETPDPGGALLELPIYTEMVPFWKMLTIKRMGLQQRGPSIARNNSNGFHRIMDFFRFQYPLKLDFCRMTINELRRMVGRIIREDWRDPASYRPIVAIGHTKDLVDFETVEKFLSYLSDKDIKISTFKEVYPKCS
jgi:hypothetical protein